MEQDDWLDQQLAASAYIPDDGFTNRVLERIEAPKARAAAISLRNRILGFAGVGACGLFSIQMAMFAPALERALSKLPTGVHIDHANAFLTSPFFLYSTAGIATLLCAASLPLIRRFV